MVELIIRGCESTPVEPLDDTDLVKVMATPLSEIAVNFHVCSTPDVLHANLSWSPAWQTGANSEGEISTVPVHDTNPRKNSDVLQQKDRMSCNSLPFTNSILDIISKAANSKTLQTLIIVTMSL